MPPLNDITAEPTLRLMLAEAGYEAALFPFTVAWAVFKDFMRLPSIFDKDAASFQVTILNEPGTDPVVSVVFGRELRWNAAEERAPGVRRVLCQFDYETLGPNVVSAFDMWSDSYTSLSAFWATVEGTEEFREARDRTPTASGLFVEDESPRSPEKS